MTVNPGGGSASLKALVHSIIQEMRLKEQWPTIGPPLLRQAEVLAYNPPTNTVALYLGGSTTLLDDVPCISDYPLAAGTTCWVLQNGSDLLVLGHTGGGAQWSSFTPTFSSDTNPVPTLGSGGTSACRRITRGKTVTYTGELTFGTSPTQPGGTFLVEAPDVSVNNGGQDYIGQAYITKATGTPNLLNCVAVLPYANQWVGFRCPNTAQIGDWNTAANGIFPLPFASGDVVRWSITYETI